MTLLYWAGVFFVLALVAALLGLSAFAVAGIAKVCFFVFLALGLLSIIASRGGGALA